MKLTRALREFTPETKTVAFTGAAGLGAVGTVALFTVTGRVLVRYFTAFCSESLDDAGGTATLDVGIASDTNFYRLSPTGGAVVLVADDFWAETGTAGGVQGGINMPVSAGVGGSGANGLSEQSTIAESIFATVGTEDITDGTLIFTLEWKSLPGAGGLVVPA
jgi:hypothetical protein